MQSKVRCCLWLALETCLKPLAIHSLWFPLLGLGAWCGKYQCVPQGQLLPTVVPGTGQENLETPRDLHPPAGCLLGLVTVRTSSCTPQQGLSSTGWGKRDSCWWAYCFPQGWYHMEGCVLPKKDGFCNTGILAADPLAPSSEPPTSEFPHTALVCSALPIPEPRETGYKLSFVHWPFKRVCVPLALSCGRQKPCCFSQPDAVGAFPSAGALGWGAQLGV